MELGFPGTEGMDLLIPEYVLHPQLLQSIVPTTKEELRQELFEAYLTPRIPVQAAAKELWPTGWEQGRLWIDPMPPVSQLQLAPPRSNGGPSDAPFEEKLLESELPSIEASESNAPGSRQSVRGRIGAPIYKPGGEALEGDDSALSSAAAAAREAALSGSWLDEYESGAPHSALAPGFKFNVFGALKKPAPADEGGDTISTMGAEVNGNWQQGYQQQQDPMAKQQQQQQQLQMEDIFSGVWMMYEEEGEDEEEEEEEGAVVGEGAGGASGAEQVTAASGAASLPAGQAVPGEAGALLVTSDPGAAALSDAVSAEELQSLLLKDEKDFWGALQSQHSKAKKRSQNAGVAKGDTEWAARGTKKPEEISAEFSRIKANLAMHWPFELDTFQKDAICRMEDGQSVFVAAHTSAGKTVVAEYALAMATKHCTRTIYTSPIKTISNQKFRDFSNKFEVGLLTGDVQIKPESPCLIMTTEILRSMLYKGADIIRDIEWVIFDEVHYVNDAERGVVWEEVIIMLPAHVNIILLSATVPNVMEFADWVGRTKRKRIHVTGTMKRPVPLEHNVFFNSDLFPVCRQEVFLPQGLKQAAATKKKDQSGPLTAKDLKAARPTGRGDGGRGRGGRGAPTRGGSHHQGGRGRGGGGGSSSGGGKSERNQTLELINLLKKKELLPVVVFCFSKKKIDAAADGLGSLNLTTATEKSEIHVFTERCLSRLKGSDKDLPQVLRVKEMLKRGLGVHHAGLLPIMKEVVEMLFCRGLIKVLFATETFAMGVNAPTRTAVFHSTRKHDGKSFRNLLPGEYTQMAGRAGRRGLDTIGTVVICAWDELPDELDTRKMMTGTATRLESQFRLTYSMILNLLRVEDLKVEDMMKRSFAEFHAQKSVPEALQAVAKIEAHLERLEAEPWPHCYLGCSKAEVLEYVALSNEATSLTARLQDAIMGTKAAQNALVPGRIVQLTNKAGLAEVGVVLGTSGDAARAAQPQERQLYILRLHRKSRMDKQLEQQQAEAEAAKGLGHAASRQKPASDDPFSGMMVARGKGGSNGSRRSVVSLPQSGEVGGCQYVLDALPAGSILAIGKDKLKVEADQILEGEKVALAQAVTKLQRAQEEAGGDPEALDPKADLKLNDFSLAETLAKRQDLLMRRAAMPCHKCPGLADQFVLANSISLLTARLNQRKHALSDANLQQMPEFHQRVAVLQELGYVDTDHTVQLKGRVACEVNTGDELLSTEIIFSGILADLSPAEAVALLSALVFQEKSDVEPELPERLLEAREKMVELAHMAGEVQQAKGLDTTPQEFASSVLRFGLMEVVYQWALGTPFSEICQLTDIMEGSIVRTVVRLEETCREFRDAARVMGNMQLFHQMEEASAVIKRDVIFAASLYVS